MRISKRGNNSEIFAKRPSIFYENYSENICLADILETFSTSSFFYLRKFIFFVELYKINFISRERT